MFAVGAVAANQLRWSGTEARFVNAASKLSVHFIPAEAAALVSTPGKGLYRAVCLVPLDRRLCALHSGSFPMHIVAGTCTLLSSGDQCRWYAVRVELGASDRVRGVLLAALVRWPKPLRQFGVMRTSSLRRTSWRRSPITENVGEVACEWLSALLWTAARLLLPLHPRVGFQEVC